MEIENLTTEKQQLIKLLATLNYWNCFSDVQKALEKVMIFGYLNALECNEVFKETNRLTRIEDGANENWREVSNRPLFKQGNAYGY